MSYDIALIYSNSEVAQVPRHSEGGIVALGGTTEACLNITYNYAPFFYDHLDRKKGIRWLYGKSGATTRKRLARAIRALGTKQYKDYWAPTPGNAGHALFILHLWAVLHPDAVWQGD